MAPSAGSGWGESQPEFLIPELPYDPTLLDDSELMILFSQYVAWENFLATRVGVLESEEETLEDAYETELALAQAQHTGSSKNVTEAKMKAKSNPKVVSAKTALTTGKALRKAHLIRRENVARATNLVSREMTRRVGRDPIERRANRWGGA